MLLIATTSNAQVCLTGKHLPRVNPNIFTPGFSQFQTAADMSTWLHFPNGCYMPNTTPFWSSEIGADGNPGCVKLRGPDPTAGNCINWRVSDMMYKASIPIQGGVKYTVSLKAKSDEDCHSPVLFVMIQGRKDATNSYTYPEAQKLFRFSPVEANEWEEFSFQFKLPDDVTVARVQIDNFFLETSADSAMVGYIDDLYIGQGASFEAPPTPKTPFDGSTVKVDELGNFEVKNREGEWEWFFPLMVFYDQYRKNKLNGPGPEDDGFKLYSKQGFNTMVGGLDVVLTAHEAIDANMMYVPHLVPFYASLNNDGSCCVQSLAKLSTSLAYLKDNFENETLLWLVDNEVHPRWDHLQTATAHLKQWQINNYPDGKRHHPIYMLNGSPGIAAKYLNDNCRIGDVTGSYIGSDNPNSTATGSNFGIVAQDHTANQKMPVAFAQINGNSSFRARIWGAIADGVRGMAYWRDYAPGNPNYNPDLDLPNTEWWADFPTLVNEIESNMDLIRQPHWTTSWGVNTCTVGGNSCENKDIVIGTRQLNCVGYLIVSNYKATAQNNITVSFTGLPFSAATVTDILSGTVYNMTNSQIQLNLAYNQAVVLKINKLINPSQANSCGECEDICAGAQAIQLDICSLIAGNSAHVLAMQDCDNGGVDNSTECNNGNDPLDPDDDCVSLEVFAFLEGAYDTQLGTMSNALNVTHQLLPGMTANTTDTKQPYDTAPWDYPGMEGLNWTDADYDATVVDWVLVSLRKDITKGSEIHQRAGLIHQDGTISWPEGCLTNLTDPAYYVVLEHRNHLVAMSPNPVPVNNRTISWDFRSQNGFTNGGSGLKEIVPNTWALFSGDGAQIIDVAGHDINVGDKSAWATDNGNFKLYLPTDFNVDGDVNGADQLLWYINNGVFSAVPK